MSASTSAQAVSSSPVAASASRKARKMLIDGTWVSAAAGGTLDVVNPATEEVIATVGAGDEADIDAAVYAARNAFETGPWGRTSGAERAAYLRTIAALVTERTDELARMETLNNGKPLPEAVWDMEDVAGCFEYYAGLAEELDAKQGTPVAVSMEEFRVSLRYEPAGVAGLITPFNYPLLMAAWKVAPALAAGCTAVLKPSEVTPLTTLAFGEICLDANLPPGVLNIVTGDGAAGAPLADHPEVDVVSFTGSNPTGSKVMTAAAKTITNVELELGGKSPIVVFDDVDVDKAVEWVMFGVFWTNGQICSATSRLLVHEDIAEALIARLVEETAKIAIGDPMADGTKLGPVVSRRQYEKVLAFIAGAVEDGCEVLAGGGRPAHLKRGFFVEPTIVRVHDTRTRIWREEVFGPVLSVMTFSSESEALRLASDTDYGLAAAVLSDNRDRCLSFARKFRTGIVWINCSQPCFVEAPWGGMKRSGTGRDLGTFGLDNFLEVKQITEYVSDEPWGWYIPKSRL